MTKPTINSAGVSGGEYSPSPASPAQSVSVGVAAHPHRGPGIREVLTQPTFLGPVPGPLTSGALQATQRLPPGVLAACQLSKAQSLLCFYNRFIISLRYFRNISEFVNVYNENNTPYPHTTLLTVVLGGFFEITYAKHLLKVPATLMDPQKSIIITNLRRHTRAECRG